MKKIFLFMFIFTIIFVGAIVANQEARLLRFPAVHENQIVFTYAGDLYTVGIGGGIARKLTTHKGFEMFPRFSPDGKHIAFTAQYDGNTEVYLLPSEGGLPKRLTFTATLSRDDVSDRMGPNNIVMGWKQNNKHIVFRSRMKNLPGVDSVLSHRMIQNWRITGFSGNSEPGSGTEVVWLMIYGFMTLKQKKR